MNLAARRVLDRIVLEYLVHGRKENGNLIVTYSDFKRFGVRRASIARAVNELDALGWIDVVERGGAAISDFRNPSRYAVTWVMRKDLTPASNRWRRIQNDRDARKALRDAARRPHKRPSQTQI